MNYSCFPTILPDLPRGYQMNLQQPFRLTPLPGADLPDIAICENCWLTAAVTYEVAEMNTLSAWMAVSDQDWVALWGLNNADPAVNANNHMLFDYLYPFHARERRAVSSIARYDKYRPGGA